MFFDSVSCSQLYDQVGYLGFFFPQCALQLSVSICFYGTNHVHTTQGTNAVEVVTHKSRICLSILACLFSFIQNVRKGVGLWAPNN